MRPGQPITEAILPYKLRCKFQPKRDHSNSDRKKLHYYFLNSRISMRVVFRKAHAQPSTLNLQGINNA